MATSVRQYTYLGGGTPKICRLGLASRGNTHLSVRGVEHALDHGINYLNWCAHPDGMSQVIRRLKERRARVVVACQFYAHTAQEAEHELHSLLRELGTDYIDVLSFYYLETLHEWQRITEAKGALPYLEKARTAGKVRLIGVTSHQRSLTASLAGHGTTDLLMIRYNAAHRGAETDVFPVTARQKIPVVAYTCTRWGALLRSTRGGARGAPLPTAPDCYRFVLEQTQVSVALMAPDNYSELQQNLALLSDWRRLLPDERERILAHGDRVYRHGGRFP